MAYILLYTLSVLSINVTYIITYFVTAVTSWRVRGEGEGGEGGGTLRAVVEEL